MNNKQMKIARKAMQELTRNDQPILFAVRGVIADLKEGKHGPQEKLTHTMNVGELTAHEEWDKDPLMINELTAAALGRMTRFHLVDNGIDISSATVEQLIELTTMSDDQQARVVIEICGIEAVKEMMAEIAAQLKEQQPGSMTF